MAAASLAGSSTQTALVVDAIVVIVFTVERHDNKKHYVDSTPVEHA